MTAGCRVWPGLRSQEDRANRRLELAQWRQIREDDHQPNQHTDIKRRYSFPRRQELHSSREFPATILYQRKDSQLFAPINLLVSQKVSGSFIIYPVGVIGLLFYYKCDQRAISSVGGEALYEPAASLFRGDIFIVHLKHDTTSE